MPSASSTDLGAERGVAQYHRLANLLRHQISSGERPVGSQLPAIVKLAADMGIASVTVRNAYEILTREGIIVSHRGRGTHVIGVPGVVDDELLIAANNDVLTKTGELIFKVLKIESRCTLPAEFSGAKNEHDDFTCIRKVQMLKGSPFSYSMIYVPTVYYDRLSKDAVKKQKVLGLLLVQHDKATFAIRQRTTVVLCDQSLAELLECPIAAPVAKMVRVLMDSDKNFYYAGTSWYRSDRFVSDIEYPANLLREMPELIEAKAE